MIRASIVVAILGTALAAPAPLLAQGDILNRAYGEGVHAFFRGDYSCAGSTMDQAIAHGSQDPRAYYFRGLSYLRFGMCLEAEEDFRMAATLEVDGTGTYDIGRALERIQGPERLCLERIRRDTLLTLSQRASTPAAQPGIPSVIPDFGRDLPQAPDPFRNDDEPRLQILPEQPKPPAEQPVKPDAAPAPAEEEDPFATAPAPDKTAPAEETADPFATPQQPQDRPVPEPPAPAETEEGENAEDIFGAEPGDNPFE